MSFPFCPFLLPILPRGRGGVSERLAGAEWPAAASLNYDNSQKRSMSCFSPFITLGIRQYKRMVSLLFSAAFFPAQQLTPEAASGK